MRDYRQCCLFKLLFLLIFLAGVNQGYAQVSPTSDWTWVDGASLPNQPGVYGTKGIAAAGNKPGARNTAGKWTDAAGNFWLFGGYGIDATGANGYLNDLWRYNPLTGLWTWVGGEKTVTETSGVFGTKDLPAPGNWPGSRDSRSISWKDASGNFWLFGGYKMVGATPQVLNDLWKYDPLTSMWTWVSGSQSANVAGVFGTKGVPAAANFPGGKHSSVGWSDASGNLWLYGGVGPADAAYQNDLWKFNLSTKQWSWEGGDQQLRSVPVYNLLPGINTPSGNPGGRFGATGWTSPNGDLWLYGGNAVYTPMGAGQVGSDLWKYDVVAKTWTWMSGSKIADAPTSYGLLGIEALGSHPGNRKNANSWVVNNYLYIFGGLDTDDRRYGDLWRFNISTGSWSWTSGDQGFDQASAHVSKGISSSSTKPGNRSKVTTWVDNNGNLWMFGGAATVGGTEVQFNDMMTFGALDCTPPVGTISPAAVDACFGSSVLLHATKDFTYQWYKNAVAIPGATDSLYTATTSGVYTVMLNPGSACEALAANPANVTINPAVIFTATLTQPSCSVAMGSITVTASGGSGTGFSYSNNNGGTWQTTNLFTGLASGNYQVIVRDDKLCLSTMQPFIINPAPPGIVKATYSISNVTCANPTAGSIIVTGFEGTAPFDYRLNNGAYQLSGNFSGLPAGTYQVGVRSADSCKKDTTIVIAPAVSTVTSSITSQTNISCAGGNTGAVTIAGANGVGPYTYQLDGAGAFVSSGTFSNLAVGPHTVIVRDANGCTNTANVLITQAVNTVKGTYVIANVTCLALNTGSINVTGSTGTAPYQYAIDAGAYQGNGSFASLVAGTYAIHIRDANLCIKDTNIVIAPAVSTVTSSITSQTNISCAGGNTGAVTIAGANGTGPYTYQLDGAGAFVSSGTFSNLAVGAHTVIVRDANGCTNTANVLITQAVNTVKGTYVIANVTCLALNTGSINVTGSTGTAPYQYAIDAGAYQGSGSFTSLVAGTYAIHIRDANLCIKDTNIVIAPAVSTVTSSITSQTNISCAGGNTGAVTIAGANGVGPYTYQLDGAGAFVSSGTFSNLAVGPHTVIVRDANGCTNTANVLITQAVNTVKGTYVIANVTCLALNTGSINVTGSTGTAPYQYAIDAGAYQGSGSFTSLVAGTYAIHIRDANLCIKDTNIVIAPAVSTVTSSITSQTNISCAGGNTGAVTIAGANGTGPYTYQLDGTGAFVSSGTFTGLAPGAHTVIVRDANGCTTTANVTIIQLNNTVTATMVKTDANCAAATGSVVVTGSGGAAPYQYAFGAGAYQGSGSFPGLAAGTYPIHIRDANQCIKDTSITIAAAVNNVTSSITSQTNISCAGGNTGEVTIAGANGAGPYTYQLDGAGAFVSSGTFTNLAVGPHTVIVRDANGCTTTANVTIIQLNNTVTATMVKTDANCAAATGSVTVTGSGGAAPYQYAFGAGAYQGSGSFPGLAAGTYAIHIRDANQCIKDTSITIAAAVNNVTSSITSQTNISCAGGNTGAVTIAGANGAGPYTYQLDGAGAFVSSGTFTNLAVGPHTVIVRDANGCTTTANVTIIQLNNTVTATMVKTDANCAAATGSVVVTGSGGAAPYQYAFGAGAYQGSGSFPGLAAGTYPIHIRDANQCIKDTSITIAAAVNNVTSSITSQTNISCAGGNTGAVTIAGANGAGPYTYQLDGTGAFISSGTFTGLAAGAHTVIVRDANGCTTTANVTIIQLNNTVTATMVKTDASCANPGSVVVTGSGGAAPYQYAFGAGAYQGSGSFPGLAAGTYPIHIRDANQCIKDTSITIAAAVNNVTSSITSQTNISCAGGNTGAVTIAGANGTGPYTYQLDGTGAFVSSGTFTGLAPGAHTVIVRDANGCTTTANVTIIQLNNTVTATMVKTDANCAAATGSVVVTGSGGAAPYQYAFGAGAYQGSGSFPGLAAGTYPIHIRDANQCIKDTSITIAAAVNNVTSSITSQTNISCAGGNTGAVTIAGANGTGPYTYQLDGTGAFVSSGTFTGLAPGAHTVIVRDANGCTTTANVTIIQLNNTVTATMVKTDANCAAATGSVVVTGSGGAAPYQYAFGAGAYQGSGSFPGLAAGTYPIHIRDANQCIKDTSITIAAAVNNVTSSITSQTNISCAGGNTGEVTIAGANGTGPYTYQLDGTGAFVSSGTFTGLAPGAHTVIVRDANGCTTTANVTIIQLNNTVTATMVKTDANCAAATGSVVVTGSGGAAPYQYAFGAGAYQGSGSFPGLAAGTYPIHIRDANQCIKDTSITIAELASTVSVSLVSKTDVSCAGNIGTITVAGAGGTGLYTYQLGIGAFQASPTFSNLAAGNYTVTAKDAAGCTSSVTVQIAQINNTVSVILSAQTNITCAPGSTGSFTVSGAGGTAPYNYKLGTGTYLPGGTFTGLAAGTYTVSIRDANSCTKDTSITIVQDPNTVLATIVSKTDIPCIGGTGSVTVAGSGGTAPYEYRIGSGLFQASNLFNELAAGNYTISVRDVVGCISNIPVTITQIPNTLTAVLGSKTDIPCTGGTGSITITAGGGTAPYNYKIGTGAYQASPTFTDLPAGNYTVTVQDASGCTKDVSFSILALPNTVIVTPTSRTDVPCTGGNIGALSVTASGGTAPYQYSLNTGLYQASGVFTGLASGSYSVTARDANGCTNVIIIAIGQVPNTVTAVVGSKTDVSCAGTPGSVRITGGGGTPPYTYKLGAGAYQVNPTFNNLAAGDYIATVRDANGCTHDVTVTIIQTSNTIVPTVISKTDIPCTGGSGSVTIAGSGGTAPYQYRLNGASFVANGAFNGLAAGSYTITVRDANGCTQDIAVIIAQTPNTVNATLVSKTDVPCSGGNIGSLTVAGGGGTAPYTYRNGTGTFQSSGVFNNLPAGEHTITVRDVNGCTAVITVNIVQLNNTVDGFETNRRDVPCSGGIPGSVTIVGTGGTPPYEYKSGNAPYRSSGVFIGLSAGNYTFTVKDAAGCTKDVFVTIAQLNNNVRPAISKTDISCLGGNTGSITISGSGGTAPYEYKIGTGRYGSNATFSSLPAGDHIVSVQDALGCSRDTTITIVQLTSSITATINAKTDITCAGGNIGSVTITGGGGTAPYSYKIGSGTFGGISTFNNLAAGEHNITIRDAAGCSKDTTIRILQRLNTVKATLSSKVDIPCTGGTGSITVTATGGTAPFEYRIGSNTYKVTGEFSGLAAGSYTVTVRDAGGCTNDTTIVINQTLNTVRTTLVSKTNLGCSNLNIGSITVVGGGGTAPFEYKLGNGPFVTSGTFPNLPAGNHVITVRDAVGCSKDTTITLTQIANTITTNITSQTNVPCTGGNVGSVTVTGGGGSGPFEYKIDTGAYQNSGTFNGLAAGSYIVTVKNALGCTREVPVVITQDNNTIVATVGNKTDVPCSGGNVGSVTIAASGGRAPLSYKIGTGQYQPGATFPNLASGNYVVTVKDGAGCTRDVPVTINQINNTVKVTVGSKTDVPCSGGNIGSVTIIATGGTAPYTYKLGNGQYLNEATFKELAAGEHTFTVKDAVGCTYDTTITIIQKDNTIKATVKSKTDIPCSGGSGSVTIDASGGTAPYTYKVGSNPYGPSPTFDNLAGGKHTVTVKDAAGCTFDVEVNIASPAGTPGTITPANTDPICAGTSQVLTASDGVSYQWFRNDTLIPGATGKTYSATESGRYKVVINNGSCSIPSSNTVNLTVNSCAETIIFVPKAFTPDNNNKNDKLAPKFINVKQFRYFKVYNRWGQLVYQTSVPGEGWDGIFKGVRQPMETYSWILECVDNNGKTIRTSGKTILIR